MNDDDYAEFSVLVDATIVVDRIDLDDSDNYLIYTDIDALHDRCTRFGREIKWASK